MSERILETGFDEELKKSYLSYAMSVIADRALPDARDGLKPVQRRVLHAMRELGLSSTSSHKKSARVVGETMGKYHPHGDSSIYDAMARMAQSFSLRLPLVDGQGNFGSLDGDSPAAMRYTEARLGKAGELMHADVDEDVVDFVPNFDGSLEEPESLPSAFPNLLVNGSSGIAVGMATNIPPHNPTEILSLAADYMDGGCSMNSSELASSIQGPDFPTGGEIVGRSGLVEMYETGRGKFTLRGKMHIEDAGRRKLLVITEIPYGTTKSRIVAQIAEKLDEKGVEGIIAVRDESDRTGDRVVVEMNGKADVTLAENLIFSATQMETVFGGNIVALVGGKPSYLSLKDALDAYVAHRRSVTKRRTEFRLKRDERRRHIVEGLLLALGNMDEVVAVIRSSTGIPDAKKSLVAKFGFSEEQADAVLEMRLSRLVGLERNSLLKEKRALDSAVSEWNRILSSETALDGTVVSEMRALAAVFASDPLCARRTIVSDDDPEERRKKDSPGQTLLRFERVSPCVVSLSDGFLRKRDVKRRPTGLRESSVFVSNGAVFAVGLDGRFYSREHAQIPDESSKKLLSAREFFGASTDDLALVSPDVHDEVVFVFADGSLKRSSFEALKGDGARKNTSRAVVPLLEGETLFAAEPLSGNGDFDVVLTTRSGRAVRISGRDIPRKGAGARGVAGMAIAADDSLATAVFLPGCSTSDERSEPLFLMYGTTSGNMFRFDSSCLGTSGRGSKGTYVHRATETCGFVESCIVVREGDELVFGDGNSMFVSSMTARGVGVHTAASLSRFPAGVTSFRGAVRRTASANAGSVEAECVETKEEIS